MDVNTRNRADLKAFFVKNSIPTQSNFADLIDGMLNQKDDGLAKASNLPLSIEAAGAGVGDSEKKAIALYQSFADSAPAWTLSLNPRTDPKDPNTAKLGFAISDGEGRNRLFVDRNNGNVGIGTVTPGARLEITGGNLLIKAAAEDPVNIIFQGAKGNTTGRIWPAGGGGLHFTSGGNTPNLTIDASGKVGIGTTDIKRQLHVEGLEIHSGGRVAGFSFSDRGSGWSEAGENGTRWSWYSVGGTARLWGGGDKLSIDRVGNVGIGTTAPAGKLEVQGGWGDWIFLRQQRNVEGGGGFRIHNPWGDSNTKGGDPSRNRLEIAYRTPAGVNLFGQFVIHGPTGNVGIGTATPGARLEIKGGDLLIKATAEDPGDIIFQNDSGVQKGRIWSEPAAGAGLHFSSGDNTPDVTIDGKGNLWAQGDIFAGNSGIYFTRTDHKHSGLGNTLGHAAIENAADHEALMILGRATKTSGISPYFRVVKLWDIIEVNGVLKVNGTPVVASSIEMKQDVRALSEGDYREIHDKLVKTPLYHYRFKAKGIDQKFRMGVISEESPSEILDETGKYVSVLDYIGFLFAAVKAQAKEIKKLEGMISTNAKSDLGVANGTA